MFDKDTEAYGTERMEFRRSDPWPDSRPGRPGRDSGRDYDRRRRSRGGGSDRLGKADYDGRKSELDDATLSGNGENARLSVWIDGRRLDFRGTLKRRGDLASFVVERRAGTSETFSLRLQDDRVRWVVGSGTLGYKAAILSS